MNTETASYQELRSFIKNNRQGNENFFGDYTHSSTQELKRLVNRFQGRQNSSNTSTNVETKQEVAVTKTTTQCEGQSTVHEVIDVLVFALDKLKHLPSYAKEQEAKAVHKKIMDFEAELLNQED